MTLYSQMNFPKIKLLNFPHDIPKDFTANRWYKKPAENLIIVTRTAKSQQIIRDFTKLYASDDASKKWEDRPFDTAFYNHKLLVDVKEDCLLYDFTTDTYLSEDLWSYFPEKSNCGCHLAGTTIGINEEIGQFYAIDARYITGPQMISILYLFPRLRFFGNNGKDGNMSATGVCLMLNLMAKNLHLPPVDLATLAGIDLKGFKREKYTSEFLGKCCGNLVKAQVRQKEDKHSVIPVEKMKEQEKLLEDPSQEGIWMNLNDFLAREKNPETQKILQENKDKGIFLNLDECEALDILCPEVVSMRVLKEEVMVMAEDLTGESRDHLLNWLDGYMVVIINERFNDEDFSVPDEIVTYDLRNNEDTI